MKSLTEIEWFILGALRDDYIEPFEFIDKIVMNKDKSFTPDNTLEIIFKLVINKMVIVKQEPIPAFGQVFKEKRIYPKVKEEILGDLYEYFQNYLKKRDYLSKMASGVTKGEAGIPFGIYFGITPQGEEEYIKYQNIYSEKAG
jgi:hypothetical protein